MEIIILNLFTQFPPLYKVRHSRMLLAGIQAKPRLDSPIKTFGGDIV